MGRSSRRKVGVKLSKTKFKSEPAAEVINATDSGSLPAKQRAKWKQRPEPAWRCVSSVSFLSRVLPRSP